jgi:hypothetical protein
MQLPAQPQTRVDATAEFFIWIRRNPLKRPESANGIQGNPSLFPWIPLVFFGFIWRKLALRLRYPRPTKGILVAMMVMVSTLVESGRLAICATACRPRSRPWSARARCGRRLGARQGSACGSTSAALSGFSRYPRRAGLITTDKSIQASSFAGPNPPRAASV